MKRHFGEHRTKIKHVIQLKGTASSAKVRRNECIIDTPAKGEEATANLCN